MADNNSEIKISELVEATQVNEDDVVMILQNGVNKQTKVKNLSKIQKTSIITETEITENTNYTIPLAYTPGNNSLEIYCEGCKLIQEENYIEVVSEGKSTTIQFKDWTVPIGTKLEFIVRN